MNHPEPKSKLLANAEKADDVDVPRFGPAQLTRRQIRSVYVGLMVTMFVAAINQTIIAPALPAIGVAFNDVESLPWVVTAFLLTATVVSPLYGKLSDVYGRRMV